MTKRILLVTAFVFTVSSPWLGAGANQDPINTRAAYVVDVWLKHTDARGASPTPQHLSLSLGEGVPGTLTFQPLRFTLPQLSPDQGDMEAFQMVAGSVSVTGRTDGKHAVSLNVAMMPGLRRPSDPNDPSTRFLSGGRVPGGAGRKDIVMSDNEAVAIDLPPGRGFMSRALTDANRFDVKGGIQSTSTGVPSTSVSDAEPVSVRNGVMTLRFEPFFKGDTTQLIVRVRKIPADLRALRDE
jgi:hypothetical protein